MPTSPAEAQEETIGLLSRTATYGADAVEIAETHAAMVFLAGDLAYKLKKAIRYSYLDYSTPALRRAACAAEFAVNRPLAPDLYLGTVPVTRAPGGELRLGGDGEAVDWLVAMRRFDQSVQFDRMAERDALPLELMRPLADRIAEVHGAAAIRSEFGGVAGLRKAIDITIENLRLAVGHGLAREPVEEWCARAPADLARQSPLLERRRTEGHVRACHGDLHLQNICLFEGRPTLFDAIEFDPELSTTDLLYDLAFLLMDLHHRGLERHASLVFNRYLDRRDEADGLAALPLFLSTRAAIRAQVRAAAARHHHEPGGIEALLDEARSYLDLALELLAPPPARLVAIGGLSGTGKSTLAQALAPALDSVPGARILRTDMLRKRAAGIAPETPLPASAYTPTHHAETYRRLLDETRICLAAGRAVIADGVFARQSERVALGDVARDLGVRFDGLWLTAPMETLERRVAARTGDASDAGVEVLRAQAGWIEPPLGWRVIDAAGDPDAVAARARAAMDA